MGWLEITTFITAQRAGQAGVPDDGITPALSADQLKNPGVQNVGDDAIFAFCMTAALKARQDGGGQGRSRFGGEHGEGFSWLVRLVAFSRDHRKSGKRWRILSARPARDYCLAISRRRRCAPRKIGAPGCASSRRRANPISSTKSCIRLQHGRASVGPRRWRRAWPSSSTSRTTFPSCVRRWKILATISRSSRIAF